MPMQYQEERCMPMPSDYWRNSDSRQDWLFCGHPILAAEPVLHDAEWAMCFYLTCLGMAFKILIPGNIDEVRKRRASHILGMVRKWLQASWNREEGSQRREETESNGKSLLALKKVRVLCTQERVRKSQGELKNKAFCCLFLSLTDLSRNNPVNRNWLNCWSFLLC